MDVGELWEHIMSLMGMYLLYVKYTSSKFLLKIGGNVFMNLTTLEFSKIIQKGKIVVFFPTGNYLHLGLIQFDTIFMFIATKADASFHTQAML